jgi:hypothetical protein
MCELIPKIQDTDVMLKGVRASIQDTDVMLKGVRASPRGQLCHNLYIVLHTG